MCMCMRARARACLRSPSAYISDPPLQDEAIEKSRERSIQVNEPVTHLAIQHAEARNLRAKCHVPAW